MQVRALGKTGIEVPVVGLGTYRVFNVHDDDAAQARCEAVVDAAMSGGAGLFDSSPMYGRSEDVLARALTDYRDDALVATKVWARDRALGEQQIEKSLDLFGTIDVLQVHNLLGFDDHLAVLRRLKSEGRIRAIGATHYLESSESELLRLMREGQVDVVQVPYHPGERWIERQILPEAQQLGIGVLAMTPLGSGHVVAAEPSGDVMEPSGLTATWAQILLRWALSDERVHAVIPATSSVQHMKENAAAGNGPWLDGDQRMFVRRVVQGAG